MALRTRWFSVRVAALVFAGSSSVDVAAQVLSQRQCETTWQGQTIRGAMQIEWLPYSQTHRIYGRFFDPSNNLIEFEVLTNQPDGVGGCGSTMRGIARSTSSSSCSTNGRSIFVAIPVPLGTSAGGSVTSIECICSVVDFRQTRLPATPLPCARIPTCCLRE